MPSILALIQRSTFDDDWDDAKDSFNRNNKVAMIAAAVIGSIIFITFCVVAALVWHRSVRRREARRRNVHNPIKTDVDAPPPYTFGQGYVSVPQNAYTGGLDVPLDPYGGSNMSHSNDLHSYSHSHSHDTSGSHSHDTSGSYSGGTSSGTSGGGSGGMS